MRTTAILAWPGCTWQEIAPAVSLLAPHREVRVLTSGAAAVRVAEGWTVAPDGEWAALAGVTEVLVPGGDLAAVWDDATLHALLRGLAAGGAFVGAVCNGAVLLARAGALDGRRCTHTCRERYAPRPAWSALLDATAAALARTVWVDEDVVVDGNILTAKPWAAIAFAKTFARTVGALSGAEAAARARSLGGARDLPGVDPYERWVVELRRVEGVPTQDEHIRGHVRWLAALEADGRIVLAGPFLDDAAGMVVLRVATREEAEALVATDPFVQSGVRRPTIRRWMLSCDDNGQLGRLGG